MADWKMRLAAAALAAAVAGPATARAEFDARNPMDVVAMIRSTGAQVELQPGNEDPTAIGTWEGFNFGVRFVNCAEGEPSCAVTLFVASWEIDDLTLDEVNSWNDFTFACPAYMDSSSSVIMWMGSMTWPSQTRAEAIEQFRFFTQCVRDFDGFLADPDSSKGKDPGTAAQP